MAVTCRTCGENVHGQADIHTVARTSVSCKECGAYFHLSCARKDSLANGPFKQVLVCPACSGKTEWVSSGQILASWSSAWIVAAVILAVVLAIIVGISMAGR